MLKICNFKSYKIKVSCGRNFIYEDNLQAQSTIGDLKKGGGGVSQIQNCRRDRKEEGPRLTTVFLVQPVVTVCEGVALFDPVYTGRLVTLELARETACGREGGGVRELV